VVFTLLFSDREKRGEPPPVTDRPATWIGLIHDVLKDSAMWRRALITLVVVFVCVLVILLVVKDDLGVMGDAIGRHRLLTAGSCGASAVSIFVGAIVRRRRKSARGTREHKDQDENSVDSK
jgi:hypothetical protein